MGCSCDRPYPFFKTDIETFSALEGSDGEDAHYTQYDLGLCYLAYKNIHELYNAAMDLIRYTKARPSKKMKRLICACKKTYEDFKRARFCLDEEEIKTRKAFWK